VVGMTAAAFADIPAPPFVPQPPRPRPQPPVVAPNFAGGPVKVEWTGRRGAPITLVLAGRNVRAGGFGAIPGAAPGAVTRSPAPAESAPPPPPARGVER
jgi:hypothetical protein